MKRRQVKPISDKRMNVNAQRRLALVYIKDERGDACERCGRPEGDGWVIDGHELVKRSQGGSITDPRNIVLLCRNPYTHVGCHPWTERQPLAAAAEGWVIRRGDTHEAAAQRRSQTSANPLIKAVS